jgi:hypothetical protein
VKNLQETATNSLLGKMKMFLLLAFSAVIEKFFQTFIGIQDKRREPGSAIQNNSLPGYGSKHKW